MTINYEYAIKLQEDLSSVIEKLEGTDLVSEHWLAVMRSARSQILPRFYKLQDGKPLGRRSTKNE